MKNETKFDTLFNNYQFTNVRNDVLKQLLFKLQNIGEKSLTEKYSKYLNSERNNLISVNGFTFDLGFKKIILYPASNKYFYFKFERIKLVKIYDEDKSEIKDEYIFNEKYLKYILKNIYGITNPKISRHIDDDSSAISLTDDNIIDFMNEEDDFIIFDSKVVTIDYENIKKYKFIPYDFKEKFLSDKFLIKLFGMNKNINNQLSKKDTNISSIFNNIINIDIKTEIFHNDNDLFALELLSDFNYEYISGNYGYLYINFEFLKALPRKERLELFAYTLLSFFPKNYKLFEEFFEKNIKKNLTKNINCLPNVIKNIIKYFEDNIFNQKGLKNNNESDNDIIITKNTNDIDNNNNYIDYDLFKNVQEAKFFFIFDNVISYEYYNILLEIINNYSLQRHFKFLIIIPLINEFTINKCFNKFSSEKENFIFANLCDLEDKDSCEEKKKGNSLDASGIFSNENEEEACYDLLRIQNFNKIYFESNTSNSILFLKKYMKYLNLEFDNKNKKISKIGYKTKEIKTIFENKYLDALNYIKIKENHRFKGFKKRMDNLELEKLIISVVLSNKNLIKLKLHSIFGLQNVQKQENIDYSINEFMLDQESIGGEAFDFAIKIIINGRNYLKIYQVTSYKSNNDLKKICLEKILIFISYIKKRFEEEGLGKLEGISFGIITFTEVHEEKVYRELKKFCKENSYEFILFDLNERSFLIRSNGISFSYDEDLYKFNDKYKLKVKNFSDIISIDANLTMLSPRDVKERNEEIENSNAEFIANNKLKRVAKFEYKGKFTDLKKLDGNYFCYYYDKDSNEFYFSENEILYYDTSKFKMEKEKKITLILYSYITQNMEYEFDSSLEQEKIKKKNKKKKNKKNEFKKQEVENIEDAKDIEETEEITINTKGISQKENNKEDKKIKKNSADFIDITKNIIEESDSEEYKINEDEDIYEEEEEKTTKNKKKRNKKIITRESKIINKKRRRYIRSTNRKNKNKNN